MVCAGAAGASSCMVGGPSIPALLWSSWSMSDLPGFFVFRETLEVLWSVRRTEPGPWWVSCPGAVEPAAPPCQACTPGSPSCAPGWTRPLLPTERAQWNTSTFNLKLNKTQKLERGVAVVCFSFCFLTLHLRVVQSFHDEPNPEMCELS